MWSEWLFLSQKTQKKISYIIDKALCSSIFNEVKITMENENIMSYPTGQFQYIYLQGSAPLGIESKGPFNNYVNRILTIFDHLPTHSKQI